MSTKGTLRKYLDLAEQGLSYDEIRDQIEADSSLDEETQRFYASRVDNYLQRKSGSEVAKVSNKNIRNMGAFMIGFGILILVFTFLFSGNFYVVPFGFLLGGTALFLSKLNA